MNELTGTYNIPSWNEATTYTISRDKEQMERGIHPVRIRAGLPDYPDEFYLQSGVDDMRKALKRERMIELMGEGKYTVAMSLLAKLRETNSIRQFLFTIFRLRSQRNYGYGLSNIVN